jgi:pimeloyl-ACP methyl ester carboxylesterase
MYITIKSHNIYYQKVGKGKDLVMIHGWKQDASTWWGVVDLLKDDFTLWLLDLPGFGRSDMPKKPFKMLNFAETVEGFINAQKLNKPILLGHSLGGRTGIKLAASYPDLLGKLILEDAAGIKPKRDLVKTLIYPFAKLGRLLIPDLMNLKERFRLFFYRKLKSDYLKAGPLRETLRNILEEDLTPELSKIKTETLLIWGEKDPTKEASLKNGKLMYKLIKPSRLEVIEGAGHFPHLEKPHLFAQYVKDFC